MIVNWNRISFDEGGMGNPWNKQMKSDDLRYIH